MFETVCIWLVCRVDILGVGIPLFLSRWLFLGGGDGGCLFARPLGMSGGNVVNWILLVSWGGGVLYCTAPNVNSSAASAVSSLGWFCRRVYHQVDKAN